MKIVGAKYGNKNVKIILVKKCFYVVMKIVGAKDMEIRMLKLFW